MKRVQDLLPTESKIDALKSRDIPALETSIKENESSLPQAIESKEKVVVTGSNPSLRI